MPNPCVDDRGRPIECAKVHEDGTRTMRRFCRCDPLCRCLCAEDQHRPDPAVDARAREGLGRVHAAWHGGPAYSTETPEGRECVRAEVAGGPQTEPAQEPASWASLPRVAFCRHAADEVCDCKEEVA